MEDPSAPRYTERLRLEPIDAGCADDLWYLHQDPGIADWYDGCWSRAEAIDRAGSFAESWRRHGVGKWLAYDLDTGALVGRGGASVTSDLGGQDVEIGWSVRGALWGRGYATEIGRAALDLVDEVLDAEEVVAYTEAHNRRSRAVMERLGMSYRGEIRHRGLLEGGRGAEGVVDDARFALYAINRRKG